MLVRTILAQKGTEVDTVAPTATVASAVDVLARRRIGALVVSPDGSVIEGILSERDIVRGLAEQGPGVLDQPVSSLMTSEVTTCVADDTADLLMGLMTDRRIRHLPVVEGGLLCGLISIGDVVKARVGELQVETQTLHEYIHTGR
ncbi:MAG TPA: CBS domain-containing protein [Acidimicrobiales bacterium]